MDDLLQQGITAYRAGKKDEARKLFISFVKQNPDNESAWGWMYQVSKNDQERIHCLNQILRINPKSEKAKKLLDSLTKNDFPQSQKHTRIEQESRHNDSSNIHTEKEVVTSESYDLPQQKSTGTGTFFFIALVAVLLIIGVVLFYPALIDTIRIRGTWRQADNGFIRFSTISDSAFFGVAASEIEFLQDGTFLLPRWITSENSGSYSLLENNRIRFEWGRATLVYKYKLTGNRLFFYTDDDVQIEYIK